jgi:3,2-trans-enoyl-CoA isomerase
MGHVNVSIGDTIATLILNRGKVNALNEAVVDELRALFGDLKSNNNVRGVILTGHGKFFSFGFDVPELYDYSPEDFTRYLRKFTGLYTDMFVFPKPLIAAVNGHAVAGGCMLATACDMRLMVGGKTKISLNEITFGSSVFAGSVDMLRFIVGSRNAEKILIGGKMMVADEAHSMRLVDKVVHESGLMNSATLVAGEMAAHDPRAFAGIKGLLRNPIAETMKAGEEQSIADFVEIWYSPETRESLKTVQIR